MSVELPENMGYGQVTARFLLTVADGPDEGRMPDGKAATGKITFTAAPDWMTNITADPPVVIIPKPIECFLDPQGYLIDPEGARGVWLPATDDEDLDPVGWTYMVQVALEGVPRRSFSIAVPEGTTRDLAKLTPVASSTGNAIVRGPSGDSAYTVAVDEGFVGTEAAWLDSLVGPAGIGVADITTDRTVGTRVMVGDVMVSGETGRRDANTLLTNAETGATLTASRSGNVVSLSFNMKPATSGMITLLPRDALQGFKPAAEIFQQTSLSTGTLWALPNGEVRIMAAVVGSRYGVTITYPTKDPWPTNLPGTPF